MHIWQVLGISETKDKDELKKAYRVKLNTVNPEDDPEGFMQLREAYEEAVRLADSDEREEEDTQEEELRRLERYLTEANESLRRFEFRYTHGGRGPEECNEELPPEGEVRKRKKRTKFPKDLDFDTLVIINPKTNKPYPVYKLKALYREGKLELPE